MKNAVNNLLYSVLQKHDLDECTIEELQHMADEYPYFGPAHVLLAAKLKTGNKEKYEQYFQKTLLYFNNPFLPDQILNNCGNVEIIPPIKEIAAIDEAVESTILVINQNEINPLPGSPTTGNEKKDIQEDEPVFEPYHTVDYFASQGIKIREEERPKDRFGQQLKSFTDWLKTMKRLPVAEKVSEEKTVIERKVEEMAEHSIEDRVVVTEAMAEVWEKQGDAQKAIAIYNKLSLQDPSKSSYFAAKIEQLKNL